MTAAFAALIAICLGAAPGAAHTRSTSYATVDVTAEGATMGLRVTAIDATRLSSPSELTTGLRLSAGDGPCVPVPGSLREGAASPGERRFDWRVRCPGAPAELRAALFPSAPSHLCFARVTGPDRPSATVVLASGERTPLPGANEPSSGLAFVPVGVTHVLGGADHLVFLLLLLLAAARARDVITTVTGFTVGHSLTLGAAALGLASPDMAAVEALIGVSIVLVAVENVWVREERRSPMLPVAAVAATLLVAPFSAPLAFGGVALFAACHFGWLATGDDPTRSRAVAAAVFGLLHGFGFAGVLADAEMPAGAARIGALLGFNVGVELGQVAVVLLAWPLLSWWRSRLGDGAEGDPLLRWGSAAGVGAGAFWVLTRVF